MAFLRLYRQTNRINLSIYVFCKALKSRPKGLLFLFAALKFKRYMFFSAVFILMFSSYSFSESYLEVPQPPFNNNYGQGVYISSLYDSYPVMFVYFDANYPINYIPTSQCVIPVDFFSCPWVRSVWSRGATSTPMSCGYLVSFGSPWDGNYVVAYPGFPVYLSWSGINRGVPYTSSWPYLTSLSQLSSLTFSHNYYSNPDYQPYFTPMSWVSFVSSMYVYPIGSVPYNSFFEFPYISDLINTPNFIFETSSDSSITWFVRVNDSNGGTVDISYADYISNPVYFFNGASMTAYMTDAFNRLSPFLSSALMHIYDTNPDLGAVEIASVPATDGLYKYNGSSSDLYFRYDTGRSCDPSSSFHVFFGKSCSVSLQTSHTDVYPQKTGNNSNTTSTVTVSLIGTAPPEGCTVDLNVEPVTDSGGHLESNHTGARPTGSITDTKAKGKGTKGKILNSISFAYNGKTTATATYTSSAVTGQEKIKAKVNGKVVGEATINVKVPDLSTLESKPNLLLWGGTVQHELNNYGTTYTKKAVYYAVDKYSKYWALNTAPSIHLAVIDMSLPWGGLFDISGNWKSPHDLHRIGRSTDFSKYYKDGSGNNINVTFYDKNGKVIKTTETIDDDWLDKKFKEKKCQRLEKKIGKIHYECPK